MVNCSTPSCRPTSRPSVVTIAPDVSCGGTVLADESGVVLVGHEANLLAVGLFGHVPQSQLLGDAADFLLAILAHGKPQPGEHVRPDAPEHVGLVLARIETAAESGSAVGRFDAAARSAP